MISIQPRSCHICRKPMAVKVSAYHLVYCCENHDGNVCIVVDLPEQGGDDDVEAMA